MGDQVNEHTYYGQRSLLLPAADPTYNDTDCNPMSVLQEVDATEELKGNLVSCSSLLVLLYNAVNFTLLVCKMQHMSAAYHELC